MSDGRVLVVGSNGLLGQKVVEVFVRGTAATVAAASVEPASIRPLQSVSYRQLDITVRQDVKSLVADLAPEVIINCAALTNVDACEKERDLAWRINVAGVENLAEAAKKPGAALVHISSDYVFDGKRGPYAEDDRPEPLSYYGKTKLASENVLRSSSVPSTIIRTIVLFGYAEGVKQNFALWLIESLSAGTAVRVVDDQMGNPTLVDDLAYAILKAVELKKRGLYHVAGRDIVSRYAFAVRLAEIFGLDPALIQPIKTSQLEQPAPRPLKSGLITLKAETELGYTPSSVDDGLAVLKSQILRAGRWAADREAAPGRRTTSPPPR